MSRKVLTLSIIVVAAIVGAAGYYIYSDIRDLPPEITPPAFPPPENTNGNGAPPPPAALMPPDLNGAIIIKGNWTESQKADLTRKITDAITALKKNSQDYDQWIQLGLMRRQAEDYRGAEVAWVFATKLDPDRSVAFGNLGVLYGYYLPDYPKSEQNFLQAIKLDPQYLYLYGQLHELYRDVLKDDTKAINILKKAIQAVPSEKEGIQKIIDNYKPASR